MEIRKCVYFGDLFSLLEELNFDENWRKIIVKPKPDKRLRDVEMVLRCLVLHREWKEYDKPMKGFLNAFMSKTKKLPEEEKAVLLKQLREVFIQTCEAIANNLPDKPFHLRGRINYAAMDSIFNAVAQSAEVPDDIAKRYEVVYSYRTPR